MLCSVPARAQQLRVGGTAPGINLPLLSGGRVQLTEHRGHAVVVSFWATWCPPCRSEFPELVRAQRDHAADGLYVLAVNGRDQEVSVTDVQSFVREFGAPFDVALDQRGQARRAYRIYGLPTTVFIDSLGIVRRILSGPISGDDLDRGIAELLAAH